MEQAKKRDHKIYVTEQAIAKVPYVKLPGLSHGDCQALWREHKDLLRMAMQKNDSNEVLTILSLRRGKKAQVLGGEFEVAPGDTPEAFGLFVSAQERELFYLHNHPSTNNFSMPDIFTLINFASVGIVSVVTNQGEAYVLQKLPHYDSAKAYSMFAEIMGRYETKEITHKQAVRDFLKSCYKAGINYAKGKQDSRYQRQSY